MNKPSELPDCKLINELILKSDTKKNFEFNYIQELDRIRNIVSIEVSRINLLFPEYTPHDEKYHLKRLFHVADELLGDNLIESMNVTEIFLLCISLYAHDWGMAVSQDEKDLIILNCNESVFSTYEEENEASLFKFFCKDRSIDHKNIELEQWREYVRLTHAKRSSNRISKHFDSVNSIIGDFAGRICEGHYLDFNVIQDYNSFPTEASINLDIVNVRAITIYLRLIDLLDLGHDRTPFILWKFVAPRNEISKIEWAKHRALSSVTFPIYQDGRYIQIDGKTEDHNVYMSIMDLKRYIDNQFRECSDILNRMHHGYHKINISHIDWRIYANGFEPIAIEFEFDRNRMFEILGDDIYQGNPYVFIRELLQNAIDAINMRMEIYSQKQMAFEPKIEIIITDHSDFFNFQITDNGIGMDEYIIRNYLTIAGKSYYKSIDFKKEGLKMDPISKFGIGILSCFMVADHLEIKTHRDPHVVRIQESLKISIPAKENYFKIEKNKEIFEIGSTFNVYILKEKLTMGLDFNITQYLKKIAGFVKYPIYINENESKIIIKNPTLASNSKNPDDDYYINYDFPFSEAIEPHYIDTAKEYFTQEKLHLQTDLGLSNYDGCITYLIPNSTSLDIIENGNSWPISDFHIIDYSTKISNPKRLKWKTEWARYESFYNREEEPETNSFAIYMDGILIENISHPTINSIFKSKWENENYYNPFTKSFILPSFIANIPKPQGLKIDLARTKISSQEKWDIPIWNAVIEYIKKNKINQIINQEASIRLISLSKLITFYRLSSEVIIQRLIDKLNFPIPFLDQNGQLNFGVFDINKFETIKFCNSLFFSKEMNKLINSFYLKYNKEYNGILKFWRGNNIILNFRMLSLNDKNPASISNLYELINVFLIENYYFHSIEFISSPLGDKFPLVQEVYKIKISNKQTEDESSIENLIRDLKSSDIENLNPNILKYILQSKFYAIPKLAYFPTPYNDKMAYSLEYLNLNNSKIKLIVQLCISIIISTRDDLHSNEVIGKLVDDIRDFAFFKYNHNDDEVKLTDINNSLKQLIKDGISNNLLPSSTLYDSEIQFEDFVENSITVNEVKKSFSRKINQKEYSKINKDWGFVLE